MSRRYTERQVLIRDRAKRLQISQREAQRQATAALKLLPHKAAVEGQQKDREYGK